MSSKDLKHYQSKAKQKTRLSILDQIYADKSISTDVKKALVDGLWDMNKSDIPKLFEETLTESDIPEASKFINAVGMFLKKDLGYRHDKFIAKKSEDASKYMGKFEMGTDKILATVNKSDMSFRVEASSVESEARRNSMMRILFSNLKKKGIISDHKEQSKGVYTGTVIRLNESLVVPGQIISTINDPMLGVVSEIVLRESEEPQVFFYDTAGKRWKTNLSNVMIQEEVQEEVEQSLNESQKNLPLPKNISLDSPYRKMYKEAADSIRSAQLGAAFRNAVIKMEAGADSEEEFFKVSNKFGNKFGKELNAVKGVMKKHKLMESSTDVPQKIISRVDNFLTYQVGRRNPDQKMSVSRNANSVVFKFGNTSSSVVVHYNGKTKGVAVTFKLQPPIEHKDFNNFLQKQLLDEINEFGDFTANKNKVLGKMLNESEEDQLNEGILRSIAQDKKMKEMNLPPRTTQWTREQWEKVWAETNLKDVGSDLQSMFDMKLQSAEDKNGIVLKKGSNSTIVLKDGLGYDTHITMTLFNKKMTEQQLKLLAETLKKLDLF